MSLDHKFQIDLRGLIDLLSDHLYSGPEVFVRELLQNATDAIRARSLLNPHARGDITLELTHCSGAPPALVATDPGIGLTAEEMHRFLATIASSSKRDRPSDFMVASASAFCRALLSVTRSSSSRGPPASPVRPWSGEPGPTVLTRCASCPSQCRRARRCA
jgi:molecular chaperone HtpG